MTDNEIVKALECCSSDEACCSECPYIYIGTLNGCYDVTKAKALDLINRLQEENEALIAGQETLQKALAEKNKEIQVLRNTVVYDISNFASEYDSKIKAEVIKEFLTLIKAKESTAIHFNRFEGVVSTDDIESLAENLVGNDGAWKKQT